MGFCPKISRETVTQILFNCVRKRADESVFLTLSNFVTSFAKFCLEFINSCDVFCFLLCRTQLQSDVCLFAITRGTLHFDRLIIGQLTSDSSTDHLQAIVEEHECVQKLSIVRQEVSYLMVLIFMCC